MMLLGATDLDLSFPSSSLTTEEIEQEIMHRSRRKDTDIVLWTWWAHTRSPLGHLFVVISMICCGVSVRGEIALVFTFTVTDGCNHVRRSLACWC